MVLLSEEHIILEKEMEAYKIGYAESSDLINWIRMDEDSGIKITKGEWDSEMMAYPAIIKIRG